MAYQISTTIPEWLEREMKDFASETRAISMNGSIKMTIHLANLLRVHVQRFDTLVGEVGEAEAEAQRTGTDEDMQKYTELNDELAHYPDSAFKILRNHYLKTINQPLPFEPRRKH